MASNDRTYRYPLEDQELLLTRDQLKSILDATSELFLQIKVMAKEKYPSGNFSGLLDLHFGEPLEKQWAALAKIHRSLPLRWDPKTGLESRDQVEE